MKHQSETGCGAQRRKAAQFSIKFAYKMKAHWPTLQHLARHVKPFSTSLHCFLSTKSSQITNTLYMYPSSIAAQKGNKICRGQCLAQTQTQASSLCSPLAVAHLWALRVFCDPYVQNEILSSKTEQNDTKCDVSCVFFLSRGAFRKHNVTSSCEL